MNKALLIGIDDYPEIIERLKGCVNDVSEVNDFLVRKCSLKKSEIKVLLNEKATRNRIIDSLHWLIDGAKKGDRLLLYYSGHGVQLPEKVKGNEADGLDEAICPYDYNWVTHTNAIIDDELFALFSHVPKGVEFIWISDSCHSGDLSDMAQPKKGKAAPPIVIMKNNVALLAGCKSEQKAKTHWFGRDYHGVLTFYLLKVLNEPDGLTIPLKEVFKRVKKKIKDKQFQQIPQLEGDEGIMARSFLSKDSDN